MVGKEKTRKARTPGKRRASEGAPSAGRTRGERPGSKGRASGERGDASEKLFTSCRLFPIHPSSFGFGFDSAKVIPTHPTSTELLLQVRTGMT